MTTPIEMLRRRANRLSHHIYSLPVVVLMPHSRCNCRCVMCDIWKANHDRRELTTADLLPHVTTLKELGTKRVVLSGGEALMHSNLWALCAAIRGIGARITLLSTGLLLKRNAANVATWCDDVIVSIDGPRSIHDQIRGIPGAFDRLAEGVAALKAEKQGYPVTARCVIQRRNFRELPSIIAVARDIGLDGISFLAADVSSEAFNRPLGWDGDRVADVALDASEVAELERILDDTVIQFAREFASGFVAENPAKLRRIHQYYAALTGKGDFPRTVCNAPWVSSVVEADGTVRPCFFHRSLGNIKDRPLDEILNSPEAVEFRQNLDVRENPICRKCVCTLNLGAREPV